MHFTSALRRPVRSLQQAARRVGLDLGRYRPLGTLAEQRTMLMNRLGTDLVLDVGANVGTFAQHARRCGFRGEIVSFEPLSQAYGDLARAAAADPLWSTRNLALGREAAVLRLNVAANSQSSSLLPMLDAHLAAFPGSKYVGEEVVEVRPLDELADELLAGRRAPLLKLDVQGYEEAVLDGAARSLGRIGLVQLECSVVPLYDGELLLPGMLERMASAGFALAAIESGMVDFQTGRTVQVDCLFVRDQPTSE
jgi:FkbM family methyltransferase